MKISAVIPVYNNQSTIAHVVDVVSHHPDIAETIVVDDGSRDASPQILKQISGIRFKRFSTNRGKGAAVAAGWQLATHDTILAVDADLSELSSRHLTGLIAAYQTGQWDMVVAGRGNSLFQWFCGERIYRKHTLLSYRKLAANAGNGLEQVINFAHRGKRVRVVETEQTGHILKYQRHMLPVAAWLYCKEGWQLAKTEVILRFKSPV